MFDADRPIQKSDQDRLGRATFAKYLARCILDHANQESLTIGLYGGFGSGKTSIINLALEELHYASHNMFDSEKPIILNFSVWSYAGQHQLIDSFFRRLTSEIRQAEYFEHSAKIIHLIELYISFFTHKPVPKSLQPYHSWISRLLKTKKTLADTYGWESGRDLTLVKRELNQLLMLRKNKLIIFIDNISRLPDKEINQVFQIVKSIGDFSNTVYILSMDKKQVIQAVNKIYPDSGKELLEKIVQLPFEIPSISDQDLEIILLDRLKKVIEAVPKDTWDADYWADVYYSALKYFFHSCRDITRYINTLSFGYEHVKMLVNPVDFFAITAIEIFEPKVFLRIRDNKDLFTDLINPIGKLNHQELLEDKARIDEILKECEKMTVEMLQFLLIRLFPRLQNIYNVDMFYHSESLARKNKRICSSDVFDIYFRLIIPRGFISNQELNTLLKMANDEAGFALALLRLNQDDRIAKLLNILDGPALQKIPNDYIQNVICALMDSSDLFPQETENTLNMRLPQHIHRIFHQLIRRFSSNEKRFDIFATAIQKAVNSIYIIVYELQEQSKEHVSEDFIIPMEFRDFTSTQLNKLKELAVTKMISWAERGRLQEHPQLLLLLNAWTEWGNMMDCQRYILEMTKQDKGLLAFLIAAFKEPIKEAQKLDTDPHIKPEWLSHLSAIEKLIDPHLLLPHASLLFEKESYDQLSDTEQLALLIFLTSVKPDTQKIFPKTTV